MREETFYFVWREKAPSPTHKHETKRDAVLEAERLAGRYPGEKFFILMALQYTVVTHPLQTVVLEQEIEIPF